MAPFPDNLPPDGLDIFYKYLLYFTILYIITTAISARLMTRKREWASNEHSSGINGSRNSEFINNETLIFSNEADNTAAMLVKMVGVESSLQELTDLKERHEVSDEAYLEMKTFFDKELTFLTSQFDLITREEEGSLDDLAEEDEEELSIDILDDLAEEDDDFLKPKSFTAPKPVAPKSFTAPKPVSPKSFTAPKPVAPKSFTAPKPVSSPPPISNKPITTPTPVTPQKPKIASKGQNFAKSTSIAAIRMDMLRELARLKKLIDEDDK